MELVELAPKEFDKYAFKHPQGSFYQISNWGDVKKKNGWVSHFLGLKDGKKIVAASLILSKKTPIKKDMFYAPRGFLIDYNDYDLLKEFTDKIKEYAKKKGAIFVKIDPYIIYQERDINGDIVEDGENNKIGFNNLIKLGYKHFGFNLMQDTLQPRWMFVTDTKNTTVEDLMKKMDPKTRQILHRNERLGIYTREIGYDEIPKFKEIMEHTGERREFIDRPLSYYQEMFEAMKDKIKIILAELNIKELISKIEDEISLLRKDYDDRKYKHDNKVINMNENKYNSKQESVLKDIEKLEKDLDHYKDLHKDGDILTLGGILFLLSGNEVLSLVGGSFDKYMEFKSAYTVHFAGVKYAIENNYERYNFYGIVGDFNPKNELYGLYTFKKSYSGYVVELIGEFDLVINKAMYKLYKTTFGVYHGVKNLKAKVHKK